MALQLAQVEPGKPVADLGCGYGRHLRALELFGYPGALGFDQSALLLAEAAKAAPRAQLIQADLRALPLHEGTLSAAFCFYSSMFLGTHQDARAALTEVARVLRPGGALVLTTDNPLRLAQRPAGHFADDVPGLGRVVEESRFDARENVDTVTKSIERHGEKLSAVFVIRYYHPPELAALALETGLTLVRLEPDEPLTVATPQLMALLMRLEN